MSKRINKLKLNNNSFCVCFRETFIKLQQSYVNSTITTNQRISHILSSSRPGGKVCFGTCKGKIDACKDKALIINSLGRIEGQLGGSGMVLRNKF